MDTCESFLFIFFFLEIIKRVPSRSPNTAHSERVKIFVTILELVDIIAILLYVLQFHIAMFFSRFSTANHFPKVKLCHHYLFHLIRQRFQIFTHFNRFFFFSFFLFFAFFTTSLHSERLASPSGLKNQQIFLIILPKC